MAFSPGSWVSHFRRFVKLPLGGVFAKFCASGKERVLIASKSSDLQKERIKGQKKKKESVFLGA